MPDNAADGLELRQLMQDTEASLASARRSLLIAAQSCDAAALAAARRDLAFVRENAGVMRRAELSVRSAECLSALDRVGHSFTARDVYSVLDLLAAIESALFDMAVDSDGLLDDVNELIDSSFEQLAPAPEPVFEEFEIDEETLEIFRAEAEELLQKITSGIASLADPGLVSNQIWEIRRSCHTFKGAAGIVGLTAASETAHKMEDLLDQIVEQRATPKAPVVAFLNVGAARLHDVLAGRTPISLADLEASYREAVDSLSAVNIAPDPSADVSLHRSAPPQRTAASPTVRVALDRLDELIKLSRSIVVNHAALAERCSEFQVSSVGKIADLLLIQNSLAAEIEAGLLKIRMMKFGTLETRLSRAVNVTSGDEQKKAYLELINGEAEVDTQIIDALVEPLLHLLKNAVVHGIEPPETRRLIGKDERGCVTVEIESEPDVVVLRVSDDGAGISTAKLRDKAVMAGLLSRDAADALSESEALQLIFERGLTTAEKIDLNAGRGVGMSIVKESVEARGGRVVVRSDPGAGSTFTIHFPTGSQLPEPSAAAVAAEPASASRLCLVIDDSPSVRHMTSRILRRAGFTVITAEDGAEAVELLLSDTRPDIIVSDVEMPQIDGWGLLEFLKGDTNFASIPVVMVTSLDGDEHRKRALDLGANGFVVKPFGIDDVAQLTEAMAVAA